MPAWVQAIGSVLAIFVAVGLAFWQQRQAHRLQRRQAERARHERVSAIGGLMEGLYGELWEAMNAVGGGGWREFIVHRFDHERLQRAITALERAPIHEVGNWRIVTSVTEAREAGIKASALLRRLQADNRDQAKPITDAQYEAVHAHFDTVNRAMAPIVRALAYDMYEGGPISEWKEHLNLPETMIPKHLRPPPIKRANRQLGRQAVALGIRAPRSLDEWAVAVWHWRTTLKRRRLEKATGSHSSHASCSGEGFE